MLFCHGCGKTYTHSHGAGLYCSAGCEGETKTRQAVEEEKLKAKGFTQHADAPHTWTKDGVSIPIELVIRQGHDVAIQTHAETVRTIASGKFAN
jgi:hypothetical protein